MNSWMTPSVAMESEPPGIITERGDATNLLELSAAGVGAELQPARLTKRVLCGVTWSASSSLIGQVMGFARSVAIARLLLPEDFGLFSMALTIVLGLNALTTMGLDQTILSRQFESDKALRAHLNTVWSAELIRSFFLALLVIACAYPAALFYNQPRLLALISVLSLATLLDGLQNIGLAILRKQIIFARIFWYELTRNIGAVALTIAL